MDSALRRRFLRLLEEDFQQQVDRDPVPALSGQMWWPALRRAWLL